MDDDVDFVLPHKTSKKMHITGPLQRSYSLLTFNFYSSANLKDSFDVAAYCTGDYTLSDHDAKKEILLNNKELRFPFLPKTNKIFKNREK